MRFSMPPIAAAVAFSLVFAGSAAADDLSVKKPAPPDWHGQGVVVTPESSVPKPEDAGKRMHTNTKIFVPTYGPPKGKRPDSASEKSQAR